MRGKKIDQNVFSLATIVLDTVKKYVIQVENNKAKYLISSDDRQQNRSQNDGLLHVWIN